MNAVFAKLPPYAHIWISSMPQRRTPQNEVSWTPADHWRYKNTASETINLHPSMPEYSGLKTDSYSEIRRTDNVKFRRKTSALIILDYHDTKMERSLTTFMVQIERGCLSSAFCFLFIRDLQIDDSCFWHKWYEPIRAKVPRGVSGNIYALSSLLTLALLFLCGKGG